MAWLVPATPTPHATHLPLNRSTVRLQQVVNRFGQGGGGRLSGEGLLQYRSGRWVLLGMTPGTVRVNGSEAGEGHPLSHDDLLHVGPVAVFFRDPPPAVPRAASPGDALHQAVLEQPDDLALRLIYADWLEEQDDPRGEFIRVQCRLAELPDWAPRQALLERERQLLGGHQERWLGVLPGLAEGWEFRRGFVEQVRLPAWALIERGAELFREVPVRGLTLLAYPEPALLDRLAECDALARITELSWPEGAGTGFVDLIARRHLERLASLSLAYSRTGEDEVRPLLRSDGVPNLRVLDLSQTYVPFRVVMEVLQSAWWERLNGLYMDRGHYRTPQPLRSLRFDPQRSERKELSLVGNEIGLDGVRLLTVMAQLASLRHLDLSRNRLPPAAAQAIAASPHLQGLTCLYLGHNYIGSAGVRALAAAPLADKLEALDLRDNGIDETGVDALVAAKGLQRLQRLDLSGNVLPEAAKEALRERFGEEVCQFG
jgi:uncharacterized protein (TIGR02996 family)